MNIQDRHLVIGTSHTTELTGFSAKYPCTSEERTYKGPEFILRDIQEFEWASDTTRNFWKGKSIRLCKILFGIVAVEEYIVAMMSQWKREELSEKRTYFASALCLFIGIDGL